MRHADSCYSQPTTTACPTQCRAFPLRGFAENSGCEGRDRTGGALRRQVMSLVSYQLLDYLAIRADFCGIRRTSRYRVFSLDSPRCRAAYRRSNNATLSSDLGQRHSSLDDTLLTPAVADAVPHVHCANWRTVWDSNPSDRLERPGISTRNRTVQTDKHPALMGTTPASCLSGRARLIAEPPGGRARPVSQTVAGQGVEPCISCL